MNVRILYRNWRGVTAARRIAPEKLEFVATPHHPVAQWILHAHDLDRDARRAFAMADVLKWEPITDTDAVEPADCAPSTQIDEAGAALRALDDEALRAVLAGAKVARWMMDAGIWRLRGQVNGFPLLGSAWGQSGHWWYRLGHTGMAIDVGLANDEAAFAAVSARAEADGWRVLR